MKNSKMMKRTNLLRKATLQSAEAMYNPGLGAETYRHIKLTFSNEDINPEFLNLEVKGIQAITDTGKAKTITKFKRPLNLEIYPSGKLKIQSERIFKAGRYTQIRLQIVSGNSDIDLDIAGGLTLWEPELLDLELEFTSRESEERETRKPLLKLVSEPVLDYGNYSY